MLLRRLTMTVPAFVPFTGSGPPSPPTGCYWQHRQKEGGWKLTKLPRDFDGMIRADLNTGLNVDGACVIHELGIGSNLTVARVDVAVVAEDAMAGYEIKSPADKAQRLRSQVGHFGRVFDTMELVADRKTIDRLGPLTPDWWGHREWKGGGAFEQVRAPGPNPGLDIGMLAHLVWKADLLEILRGRGIGKGKSGRSKDWLVDHMVENIPAGELAVEARRAIIRTSGYRGSEHWRDD